MRGSEVSCLVLLGVCTFAGCAPSDSSGDHSSSSGGSERGDSPSTGAGQDAAVDGRHFVGVRDASVGDDDDAGRVPVSWRTPEEECRPYTNATIDFTGYANDFPYEDWDPHAHSEGRDIAFTWTAEHKGLVQFMCEPWIESHVTILQGHCGGWPPDSYIVQPGQEYTFVVEVVFDGTDLVCELVVCPSDAECTGPSDAPPRGYYGEPLPDGVSADCGFLTPDTYDWQPRCAPMHFPGELDDRCPDTTWRASSDTVDDESTVVKGCCLPSGLCGHFDARLGCHTFATNDWRKTFYCDDRAAPNPPAYFQCSSPGDACMADDDCCDDPGGNYGGGLCEGTCSPWTG